MNRLLKSPDHLMKCLGFVLLFGFISLGAIGGCNNNGGGDPVDPGGLTSTLEISNEGPMTTVFVNFGAENCIKVEDWLTIACTGEADASCMKTGDLNCNFTIDSGSKCIIPLQPCGLSSFVFGIGSAPACGTTPFNGPTGFEFSVYGATSCSHMPGCDTSQCDCADITVVNGFTVPISVTMSDGPTTLGPVTSGGVTDNENNFGVFPVGCTTCVTRANCPCPGPGLDCASNEGCHPPGPNPQCQASQSSGGTITLNILEN